MGTEYFAVVFTILFTIATSALLGNYMHRMFTGGRTLLDPVLVPIERLVLRLTGVDPTEQQDWKQYSSSLLISNIFMWLATFAIVSLQAPRRVWAKPTRCCRRRTRFGLAAWTSSSDMSRPTAVGTPTRN